MAMFPPADAPDIDSRAGSPPYLGALSTTPAERASDLILGHIPQMTVGGGQRVVDADHQLWT